MKKILNTLLFAALCVVSLSQTSHASKWSYSGETGPAHWGDLSTEYTTCAQGKNQSPVDITKTYKYDHAPIIFKYNQPSNSLYFSGHGMALNFAAGKFSLNGHTYSLQELHFHSPSEHRIKGKSFPLEAHFVNSDKDGKLAVVSVLFRQGVENKHLKKIIDKAPEKRWKYSIQTFKDISAHQFLPRKKTYYRLNGSLTTPPCSEGVIWLVMRHKVTISTAQITALKEMIGAPNNRPVQPLNYRMIIE